MKNPIAAFLALMLAAFGSVADAQTAVRLRGVITGIAGSAMDFRTREGEDLKITLAPNATFAYMKQMSLADVKPGTGLGTSAVKGLDGKLVARELHLFPAGRPIPAEGHRPWDLEPGSTMTNATVTGMVQATSGHEITLTYKEGSQQVVIPPGIPIVMAQDGDRSLLVKGEYAFVSATVDAEKKITATRVQVTKDGVKPPQ